MSAVARRVDEVIKVRNEAQRLKLYARQAKDRGMIADAAELQLNAERRLGEMLVKAKSRGQLSKGGRPRGHRKPVSDGDGFSKVTLKAASISKNLSASHRRAARAARLGRRTAATRSARERVARRQYCARDRISRPAFDIIPASGARGDKLYRVGSVSADQLILPRNSADGSSRAL